jgi:hypothetical protein
MNQPITVNVRYLLAHFRSTLDAVRATRQPALIALRRRRPIAVLLDYETWQALGLAQDHPEDTAEGPPPPDLGQQLIAAQHEVADLKQQLAAERKRAGDLACEIADEIALIDSLANDLASEKRRAADLEARINALEVGQARLSEESGSAQRTWQPKPAAPGAWQVPDAGPAPRRSGWGRQ